MIVCSDVFVRPLFEMAANTFLFSLVYLYFYINIIFSYFSQIVRFKTKIYLRLKSVPCVPNSCSSFQFCDFRLNCIHSVPK